MMAFKRYIHIVGIAVVGLLLLHSTAMCTAKYSDRKKIHKATDSARASHKKAHHPSLGVAKMGAGIKLSVRGVPHKIKPLGYEFKGTHPHKFKVNVAQDAPVFDAPVQNIDLTIGDSMIQLSDPPFFRGNPHQFGATGNPHQGGATGNPHRSGATGNPHQGGATGNPHRSGATGNPHQGSATGNPHVHISGTVTTSTSPNTYQVPPKSIVAVPQPATSQVPTPQFSVKEPPKLPGYVKYPNWQGSRGPQGYPVPPHPIVAVPQQVVPKVPLPTFSGKAPGKSAKALKQPQPIGRQNLRPVIINKDSAWHIQGAKTDAEPITYTEDGVFESEVERITNHAFEHKIDIADERFHLTVIGIHVPEFK